jgi:hypothetical protein
LLLTFFLCCILLQVRQLLGQNGAAVHPWVKIHSTRLHLIFTTMCELFIDVWSWGFFMKSEECLKIFCSQPLTKEGNSTLSIIRFKLCSRSNLSCAIFVTCNLSQWYFYLYHLVMKYTI